MANDIELVIKIPEEDYNNIEPFLNGQTIKGGFNLFKALKIIKNGTPLPKGHGNLIDVDTLWIAYQANDYDFYEALDDVETIIEADPTRNDYEICNGYIRPKYENIIDNESEGN